MNIQKINQRLAKDGAKWRAVESRVSRLTPVQFKQLLGWKPNIALAKSKLPPDWTTKSYKWSPGQSFDKVVDWRNRNGKNFVTPVRPGQGGCGTCVSFAVAGLIESMALIQHGITLDLSEADLGFCGSHGADCGAWDQGDALNDVQKRGVVSENRFPYLNAFPNKDDWQSPPSCMVVANRDRYAVKISGYENIYSVADRKSYLTHVGPMVAGISVYDDFSPAPGAVYAPSSMAKKTGGHLILIIGYSDIENYWLCKNSWGTDWGDKGYCKIAYGACDIDTETATVKTYFTNCDDVLVPELVKDEFLQGIGQAPLRNIPTIVSLDGFYSSDDNMRHAIVGKAGGDISEIFYHPKTGIGQTVLSHQAGLLDLGAFYTDDDKFRHVITLTTSGDVSEIFYSPGKGQGTAHLGQIAKAIRVCGFFTDDDKLRHAIVATSTGEVFEIFYGPQGKGQAKVGAFNNIVDIGAFYSPDDNYRHVIVGTADGNITEIYYHPQKGISQALLANVQGAVKLSAFYTSKGQSFNRRVQVLTANNTVTEIRYESQDGLVVNLLPDQLPAVDLGGFYSQDDKVSHSIVSLHSGDIKEIFYTP
jgi:hypothetical protein